MKMKLKALILSILICSMIINQIESLILFKGSINDDYAKTVLHEHNRYRKKHCVDPLILDDEINQSAQKYSKYLADNDIFEHSDGSNGYGENLYWYSSSKKLQNFKKVNASGSWYDEVYDYDYAQPGFSSSTGHFTQLVWKNTKKLGVGISLTADGKSVYVVAQYDPPGNYEGEYEENVLKPNC